MSLHRCPFNVLSLIGFPPRFTLYSDQFEGDTERALVDRKFREQMRETPEGTVALTILLDQVPRNIFRGTRRPFVEFDPLARETVKDALARGICAQMHPIFRHFLFMVWLIPMQILCPCHLC